MADRLYAGHGPCFQAAVALGEFTYAALAAEAGVSYTVAAKNVRHWEHTGMVTCLGVGDDRKRRYALIADKVNQPVPDLPPCDPVKQTPEGNMWAAARQMATFSPLDLAAHAATDDMAVTVEDAKSFCRVLMRGAYLKVVRKAVPGKKEAVYRLRRNTGPLPPRERRVTGIWDANLQTFVQLPEAQT